MFVVLWPVLWRTAVRWVPPLGELEFTAEALRYATALHPWSAPSCWCTFISPPAAGGSRRAARAPILTFVLWLVSGAGFGIYFTDFNDYSKTYAGLAGVVAALFFLWLVSVRLPYRRRAQRHPDQPGGEAPHGHHGGDGLRCRTAADDETAGDGRDLRILGRCRAAASASSRRSARRRAIS